MTRAQDRFVHQNRPLAEWLLQLVDADADRRRAAADVITNRFFLALDQIPPADFNEAKRSQDLFAAEVRRVVNTPDFPAADFVRRLLSLDLALQESWMETIRAHLERGHELEPHEVTTTGAALGWVIGSLGRELLPAADLLRVMMETRGKQHMAFDAIARMGRDGLSFYDEACVKAGSVGPQALSSSCPPRGARRCDSAPSSSRGWTGPGAGRLFALPVRPSCPSTRGWWSEPRSATRRGIVVRESGWGAALREMTRAC